MTETLISDSRRAEWYNSVITGYVATASAVSIGLSAMMATGVV